MNVLAKVCDGVDPDTVERMDVFENKFTCPLCERVFSSTVNLNAHIRLKHAFVNGGGSQIGIQQDERTSLLPLVGMGYSNYIPPMNQNNTQYTISVNQNNTEYINMLPVRQNNSQWDFPVNQSNANSMLPVNQNNAQHVLPVNQNNTQRTISELENNTRCTISELENSTQCTISESQNNAQCMIPVSQNSTSLYVPTAKQKQSFIFPKEESVLPSTTKIVTVVNTSMEDISRGEKLYSCSECGHKSDECGSLYLHMQRVHNGFTIKKKINQKRVPLPPKTGKHMSPVNNDDDEVVSDFEVVRVVESSVCESENHSQVQTNADLTRGKKFVFAIDIPRQGLHRYKCSACTKTASTTGALYKHMRKEHKGFAILKKRGVNEENSFNSDERSEKVENLQNDIQAQDKVWPAGEDNDNAMENEDVEDIPLENEDVEDIPLENDDVEDIPWENDDVEDIPLENDDVDDISLKNDDVEDIPWENDDVEDIPLENDDVDDISLKNDDVEDIPLENDDMEDIPLENNQDRPKQECRYKCSQCDYKRPFLASEFYKHMKRKHADCKIIYRRKRGVDNDDDEETPKTKTVEILKIPGVALVPRQRVDRYECTDCHYTAPNPSGIHVHMKRIHGEVKSAKRLSQPRKRTKNNNDDGSDSGCEQTKVAYAVYVPFNGNQRYKCSECYVMCCNLSSVYRHIERKHKRFKLIKYSEQMESMNMKTVKMVDISNNEVRSYKCSECGTISSNSNCLLKHIRSVHKGCRIRKLNGAFELNNENSSCEDEHVNLNHDEQIPNNTDQLKTVWVIDIPGGGIHLYKCSNCSHTGGTTGNLYRHIWKYHNGCQITKQQRQHSKGSISADIDVSEESNEDDDDKNISTIWVIELGSPNPDNGDCTYKCSKCDYTNKSAGYVYVHMKRKHKGCRIVKRLGKDNLEFADVELDQFECSECGLLGMSQGSLYTHMRRHHRGLKIIKMKGDDELNGANPNDDDYDMKTVRVISLFPRKRKKKKRRICTKRERIPNNDDYTDAETVQAINNPNGGDKDRYKCSKCQQTGGTTGNIYKHIKRMHENCLILKKRGDNVFISGKGEKATNNDDDGNDVTMARDVEDVNEEDDFDESDIIDDSDEDDIIDEYITDESDENNITDESVDDEDVSDRTNSTSHRSVKFAEKYNQSRFRARFNVNSKSSMDDSDSAISKVPKVIMYVAINGNQLYKCSVCDFTCSSRDIVSQHVQEQHKETLKKRKGIVDELNGASPEDVACDSSSSKTLPIMDSFHKQLGDRVKQQGKDKQILNKDEGISNTDDYSGGTVSIIDNPQGGVHRYKCSKCDHTSNESGNLYKHMRRKHKECVIVFRLNSYESVSAKQAHEQLEGCKNMNGLCRNESLLSANVNNKNIKIEIDIDADANHIVGEIDEDCYEDDAEINDDDMDSVCVVDNLEAGDQKYKCSKCDFTGRSTSNVYSHMERRHKGCTIIKRQLRNTRNIDEIDKMNSVWVLDNPESRQYRYKCSRCDYSGKCTSTVYKHMKRKHKGLEIIYRICGNKSLSKTYMKTKRNCLKISEKDDIIAERKVSDVSESDEGDIISESEEEEEEDVTNENNDIIGGSDEGDVDNKSDENESKECEGYDIVEEDDSDHDNKIDEGLTMESDDLKTVRLVDVSRLVNKKKLYKCSQCGLTSVSTACLYSHMRNYHKGFKILKNIGQMCKISQGRAGKKKGTDESDGDNMMEENNEDSDNNMNMNTVWVLDNPKGGDQKYKCSKCDYTGRNTSHMYSHMECRHKGCTVIKRQFRNERTINESDKMNSVCVLDNLESIKYRYKCSRCDYSVNVMSSLYNHMKRKHKGLEIIYRRCRKESMNNTVWVLDNPKGGYRRYTCSKCGEADTCTGNLYRHMTRKHQDCHIVKRHDQSTNEEQIFNNDADQNVDQKIQNLKCSECGLIGTSQDYLYTHMREYHKGLKIIKRNGDHELNGANPEEDDCNMKTVRVIYLSTTEGHGKDKVISENGGSMNCVWLIVNPDGGDEKYKCSKCGHTCGYSGNLYRHMRAMHKGYKILTRSGNELNSSYYAIRDKNADTDSIVHPVIKKSKLMKNKSKSVKISDGPTNFDEWYEEFVSKKKTIESNSSIKPGFFYI